jgi:hypothetical protein
VRNGRKHLLGSIKKDSGNGGEESIKEANEDGGKEKCYFYHDTIIITGQKIEMITNCYSWKDITFSICPNQGKIDE